MPTKRDWVDIDVLSQLESLDRMIGRAIISIHRINAINTADGKVKEWTPEQREFIEETRLAPIIRLANVLPRKE